MAKQYEYLPHTADVKFKAYGKDLEEAFKNAALATFDIMTDIKKVKTKIEKEISVKAIRKETLLYDFLEALLYQMDTEGFLLHEVKDIEIKKTDKGYTLNALVAGDEAEGYDVSSYIKSVTYSDMFIKEEKGKVTIQVVHDI